MGVQPDTDVSVKAPSYSIASSQQIKELGVITVMGAVAGMLVGCLLGLTVLKWKEIPINGLYKWIYKYEARLTGNDLQSSSLLSLMEMLFDINRMPSHR